MAFQAVLWDPAVCRQLARQGVLLGMLVLAIVSYIQQQSQNADCKPQVLLNSSQLLMHMLLLPVAMTEH
jgi:hypothetical protein